MGLCCPPCDWSAGLLWLGVRDRVDCSSGGNRGRRRGGSHFVQERVTALYKSGSMRLFLDSDRKREKRSGGPESAQTVPPRKGEPGLILAPRDAQGLYS